MTTKQKIGLDARELRLLAEKMYQERTVQNQKVLKELSSQAAQLVYELQIHQEVGPVLAPLSGGMYAEQWNAERCFSPAPRGAGLFFIAIVFLI